VLYCAFGEAVCEPFNTITTTHYDDQYGNCYTWNGDDHIGPVQVGVHNGLHLILNADNSDYLPYLTGAKTVIVVIHEPGTMPLPVIDGKTAAVGFETELALQMNVFDRLGEPYAPGCADDYMNFTMLYGYEYTTKACQSVSEQYAVLQQCACADVRQPQPIEGVVPLCNTTDPDTAACVTQAYYNYNANPSQYVQCPLKCTELQYQTLMSMSTFPSNAMVANGNFQKAYGFSPVNTASVRVFYRNPLVVTLTDIPSETDFQFIGWLGGQLFVWTGTSAITVLEVFAMLGASALVLFTENVDWLLSDTNEYQY